MNTSKGATPLSAFTNKLPKILRNGTTSGATMVADIPITRPTRIW